MFEMFYIEKTVVVNMFKNVEMSNSKKTFVSQNVLCANHSNRFYIKNKQIHVSRYSFASGWKTHI